MKTTLETAVGDTRIPTDLLAKMNKAWATGYLYAK